MGLKTFSEQTPQREEDFAVAGVADGAICAGCCAAAAVKSRLVARRVEANFQRTGTLPCEDHPSR
jgi:hypothetical protein